MIITLMTREKYNTITLPEKIGGQYWLKYYDNTKGTENSICIEGVAEQWLVKSNKRVLIIDNEGKTLKNTSITPLNVYYLKIDNSEINAFIYTEPVTEDRQVFNKYMIQQENLELSIGRGTDNDIIFGNKFVSANHAKITYKNKQFTITDLDSANGTFVNEKRIRSNALIAGDTVYIMGLKIIIGESFLAFNNPDGQVAVKAKALLPYIAQIPQPIDDDIEEDETETNYFYRSPRFKRDVDKSEFKVDSPPQSNNEDETPFMMVMGPSLTMGLASMTSGIFAINNALTTGDMNNAIPAITMSVSMLLGTLLWPVVTKQYEKRRKRIKEEKRQKKYREYLNKVIAMFNDACAAEEEILHENFVDISTCIERIQQVQRNLWERSFGHNDFLKLRVGLGDSLLSAQVQYSERRFSVEEDNLQEEMLSVCESPKTLKNVPIVVSLFDDFISGVIGNPDTIKEFAKGLIFQVASLYSYDEVKMVFIIDELDMTEFSFVKWLPHVWSNDRNIRFVATNQKEIKEISAYLEREIEVRKQFNDDDMADVTPYYVIFSMSKTLSVRCEMLRQLLAHKENMHISLLSFFTELKDLPKESSTVVELDGKQGKIYDKNDISGKHIIFKPDIYLKQNPTDLSVQLANIPLDTLASSYKLPALVTFLEMFGVGKVEHLNALTRWKENNPTGSLEAAVGVNALGDLFKLDLHEKFHGPHGLVAGMTGSGKSEFIITYILSLAVNYHPNEVAFILIDYKGGGMAKAFENLPHTAGIITNLDGAEVKRSLISIESELKRRQAIFAEASKNFGVSNIDIYKYQKLFRDGSVTEPLQHLFIISDEFAELKTQQPEFMAQLISAARIGRSLGVHLILATQKPSGVVDDQIWSNSRFRVCLKVQERSDSMDMLKRADAAELAETGRFYLQVGYNELFELGQSAWAGAPYYPSEKVVVDKDESVTVIDRNGRPIKQARLASKHANVSNPKKQLDVITAYLQDIAKSEKIKIKPLWLDPIPAVILVDNIKTKYRISDTGGYTLNPVIGEYDDPARQRQNILRLPLSAEGNVVVYGAAGSGKTTFLTTMFYSLMSEHSPEEVNIYILDFASETLRAFAKAPHVGDVILSFEAEKVSNLFKMLHAEINSRKKKFADYGGDYQSYIKASSEKLPSIVVAINNFAAFTETYEEKEDAIAYLSREGTKYGIYFVLAAIGISDVRFRMMQNFSQLFVLQLNDEADYTVVVGKTDGLYPSKHKGRGLVKTDGLYEFQIAHVCDADVPFGYIREVCDTLQQKWKGYHAKSIPLLPDQVSIEFIANHIQDRNSLIIPLGVDKSSLEIYNYDFQAAYINMVLSSNDEYIDFFGALIQLFVKEYSFDMMAFDVAGEYHDDMEGNKNYFSSTTEIEKGIAKLFDTIVERNNKYKDEGKKGKTAIRFNPLVVLINSIDSLKETLSSEGNEKLSLLLEKGDAKYGVTIIVAEPERNLSGYTFEKWYKQHIVQTEGIWVGSGFGDQYQLKANKTTSEMSEEMEANFGYVLVKGKATKIKLLSLKETEEF